MYKIIEVKQSVFEDNNKDANKLREECKDKGVFLLNVMSSPGAGKTTTLSRTLERLKDTMRIGIMEADIDSAKLFTRLDELKKKDLIYIHVCKKELVYEVVDSIVVEPEAILDIGIEKNRDLLSLVTCTPYGINTKRLVVRAKRVFPKKKEKKVRKSYSFRELCFILIPIICVMVVKW